MSLFSKSNVLEISNRAAINSSTGNTDVLANRISNHESGLNTNAHQINNISGLQTALNGKANSVHTHSIANVTGLQTALNDKQNVISGYTGNISVVTGVNFDAKTITKVTINVSNGIIISIN